MCAPEESAAILEALGCAVEAVAGGDLAVEPPSWRGDIEGEADLVEEVLRITGYDHIPAVPLPRETALPRPALIPARRRSELVRRALAARGLVETVTFSFISAREAALFGGAKPELRLVNPISADLDAMRPSLLPGLVAAARRNADRGFADAALFEIGPALSRRHPRRPGAGRRRAARRAHRPQALARAAARDRPLPGQGRRARGTRRDRRPGRERPDHRRPAAPGIIPAAPAPCGSGPKPLGAFGELHPGAARSVRPAPAARRVRGVARRSSPSRARQRREAAAATVGVSADRARFRLCRRPRAAGRGSAARRARRRPQARRRRSACSTSTKAPACRPAKSRSPSPSCCSRRNAR